MLFRFPCPKPFLTSSTVIFINFYNLLHFFLIFFSDNPALKAGFEFQRISIDRSKMSEEEAFEHAIEMIQTRQMGFRKAADFFSVSKWKLYKTARKRGIYKEIKRQNQEQVSYIITASVVLG